MIYLLNTIHCLVLLLAVYQSMIFVVDLCNFSIQAIKDNDDESIILDNRHLIFSWILFALSLFIKSVLS